MCAFSYILKRKREFVKKVSSFSSVRFPSSCFPLLGSLISHHFAHHGAAIGQSGLDYVQSGLGRCKLEAAVV